MFAHTAMNDASIVSARRKTVTALDISVVRNTEIRRSADEHWHHRSKRVDDFTTGDACCDRFRVFKLRQVLFPARGQLTADCLTKEFAIFRVRFFIALYQLAPLVLQLLAAFDRFAKVAQHLVRNVKLLVFRPTKMSLRFAHGVFTRRIAVSFARALSGHAEADDGLYTNETWLVVHLLRVPNCRFDIVEIVAVLDRLGVPSKRFKPFRHIFAKREIREAVDRDVVIVVEIDQVADLQVTAERSRFRSDSFHQIAVGNNRVDVVIYQRKLGFIELRRKMRRTHRHADAVCKSLAQWTGSDLHA